MCEKASIRVADCVRMSITHRLCTRMCVAAHWLPHEFILYGVTVARLDALTTDEVTMKQSLHFVGMAFCWAQVHPPRKLARRVPH